MKLNFATFASSNWTKSPKRFHQQLDFISEKYNLFDRSFVFNENDLGKEYLDKFSPYFSDHGFGYFSWKPVVLLTALKKLNDGDVLFYIDGGCTFPMGNINNFVEEFQKNANQFFLSDKLLGLTSFQEKPFKEFPGFPNVTIIRKEILQKFDLQQNKEFLFFYPHWQAGLVLCRKNQETIDFLNEWYQFFLKNYETCIRGEYRDRKNQHPLYIQNGSDQAIMQCLLFKKNTKIFDLNFIHKYGMIAHLKE